MASWRPGSQLASHYCHGLKGVQDSRGAGLDYLLIVGTEKLHGQRADTQEKETLRTFVQIIHHYFHPLSLLYSTKLLFRHTKTLQVTTPHSKVPTPAVCIMCFESSLHLLGHAPKCLQQLRANRPKSRVFNPHFPHVWQVLEPLSVASQYYFIEPQKFQ